ncbi:MAG: hypothetical protein WBB23_07095 [Desulforhopalus sp.]
MPFLKKMFECSNCNALLSTDKETSSLLPCSECGTNSPRPINDIKETLVIKVRPSGATGGPDLRIKIADDFHKDTMTWRQLKMSINKVDDVYEKTVINPETDEVLYHNKEPLSSHKGRGSAKNKSKDSGDK